MYRESDGMLPFGLEAFFSIEDVPCLSAWLFLCVFPWGVSAVVLFFFFEAVGLFIYVEKQGFRHLVSTVRSRFSVFWYRLPASSADIGKSLSAE